MLQARFRLLSHWPRPATKNRRVSAFSAGYQATLDLLERELRHLRARDVVVQVAFAEKDIRNDGWPRADARQPSHPGVILTFASAHGPLEFATDAFTAWQANLRAIALSLEALRAVDRYGVTKRAEQYRGWAALSEKAGAEGFAHAGEAAEFIARAAGCRLLAPAIVESPAALDRQYREAAKRLHPDAGGTHEEFIRLQQAAELVRAEHERRGK